MKGPAIFVFLVGAALATGTSMAVAQYRAQQAYPCMSHSQHAAAYHPQMAMHQQAMQHQAMMQMTAHHSMQQQPAHMNAQYAMHHQAMQTNAHPMNAMHHQAMQTNAHPMQHQINALQQQAMPQAWHAQTQQATSVAVVPACNHSQNGSRALIATASPMSTPIHLTASHQTTQWALANHSGLLSNPNHSALNMSTVDPRYNASTMPINLNAANLSHLNNAIAPASTKFAPANLSPLPAGPYTPSTANALTAQHACGCRSPSENYFINVHAAQTMNLAMAAPQSDFGKFRYQGGQPGNIASNSAQSGSYNMMSMQYQMIGEQPRHHHHHHMDAMQSGYFGSNNPMGMYANPMSNVGGGYNPMGMYANPMIGGYNPMGMYANPMIGGYNPMGMYANPMIGGYNPMGMYANPMIGGYNPMGMYANPMIGGFNPMGMNVNPMMPCAGSIPFGMYADPMWLAAYAGGNPQMAAVNPGMWAGNMAMGNMLGGYPNMNFGMNNPGMIGWNANMMPVGFVPVEGGKFRPAAMQDKLVMLTVRFQLAQFQQADAAAAAPAAMPAGVAPVHHNGAVPWQAINLNQQVQFQHQNCGCHPNANPALQQQMQFPMQMPTQAHQGQVGLQQHALLHQNAWRPARR